jgi:hypothetical protein
MQASNVMSSHKSVKSEADRGGKRSILLRFYARLNHDGFERFSFGLHADMKVVPEDFLRYMADDLADSFLSGSGFGELRNQRVTMIVPPAGMRQITNSVRSPLDLTENAGRFNMPPITGLVRAGLRGWRA